MRVGARVKSPLGELGTVTGIESRFGATELTVQWDNGAVRKVPGMDVDSVGPEPPLVTTIELSEPERDLVVRVAEEVLGASGQTIALEKVAKAALLASLNRSLHTDAGLDAILAELGIYT